MGNSYLIGGWAGGSTPGVPSVNNMDAIWGLNLFLFVFYPTHSLTWASLSIQNKNEKTRISETPKTIIIWHNTLGHNYFGQLMYITFDKITQIYTNTVSSSGTIHRTTTQSPHYTYIWTRKHAGTRIFHTILLCYQFWSWKYWSKKHVYKPPREYFLKR